MTLNLIVAPLASKLSRYTDPTTYRGRGGHDEREPARTEGAAAPEPAIQHATGPDKVVLRRPD